MQTGTLYFKNNRLIAAFLEILVWDQVMLITKREQLTKLHDQLSKRCTCGISKMIQPLYFLPLCLQFLWIQLLLSVTTRFIDESFVSHHLIWHIHLNKTHCDIIFLVEFQQVSANCKTYCSKTENYKRLLRQSHYAVQISFLQSFQTSHSFKIPRLRRSVSPFK